MKVGETDENGAFSIGENPIVAQHFFLPQLRAVLSRKIDILSASTSPQVFCPCNRPITPTKTKMKEWSLRLFQRSFENGKLEL